MKMPVQQDINFYHMFWQERNEQGVWVEYDEVIESTQPDHLVMQEFIIDCWSDYRRIRNVSADQVSEEQLIYDEKVANCIPC